MKILKVMVPSADSGALWTCDAIEYEGLLWLVPHWLQNTDEGWMTPTRIIHPVKGNFQPGGDFGDYILMPPVPKAVLDGHESAEAGEYVVVEQPDIRVSTGGVQ